jgi:hypothetical protein
MTIVLVNKGKNWPTPGAEQHGFAELTLHIVDITPCPKVLGSKYIPNILYTKLLFKPPHKIHLLQHPTVLQHSETFQM